MFGMDSSLIQPVVTHDLGQAASRPLQPGMLVEKAEKAAGLPPLDYMKGLRAMASEWVN